MTWQYGSVVSIFGVFACVSLLLLQSIAPLLVPSQLFFFIVGGVLLFVGLKTRFEWIIQTRYILYGSLLVLLCIPLVLGVVTRGSAAWIPIGSFHVQPSQLVVPLGGIVWAKIVSEKRNWVHTVLKMAIAAGVPIGLVALEPDFGTTVVSAVAVVTMIFSAGIPYKYVFGSTIFAIVVLAVVWNTNLLAGYQRDRVLTFLNPSGDVSGRGYNARQSLIAVGSGEVAGRGLGQGVQSQLRFLPERHTDFMFASISEEHGFIGSSFVIGMYSYLFYTLLSAAQQIQNSTAKLYIVGQVGMLAFQTVVNIGMNIGLLPITGITLPFISYGGSSILSLAVSCGVILSIFKSGLKRPVHMI